MKHLLLSIIMAIFVSSSMAGAGTGSCADSGAACPVGAKSNHYFMFGGALVNTHNVNERLHELGYGGFSRYGLSLGFGGLRQYRRYITGGEIEGIFWKRNKDHSRVSMLNAGRLISLHGFSVLSLPSFSLYPLIGIGGGVTSLLAGPKEVPFDSAFAIPSQLPESSPLYQFSFLVDLGVGMHFSHPAPRGRPGVMTIGLRAGYIFDPIDNDRWYRNGTRLTGGPDSDLSGPYLRLTLGGSHGGKKMRHGGGCPYKGGSHGKACGMHDAG